MKKAKKSIFVCITMLLLFVLSACGGNGDAVQEGNYTHGGTFTIEEIQDNPANYVGTITLIGIVGDSGTQDFVLQNEDRTFEILVDYRGSQAIPQLGDRIIVEGTLRENRPCCGPGFTITSTQFELVE